MHQVHRLGVLPQVAKLVVVCLEAISEVQIKALQISLR